ncbi:MAG TPA: DUF2809 domain-containing protein [Spirochaetota bacterium]|nr:DUF2809 domain-containing protein [Spirochaetota bacterium]HPK55656.1 DUF2809 domain-containing protein [Spirochaetota bacterium]HQE57750.1 DUF2809 domain-containing protein [Spirochaetota bacterium]
MKITIFALKKRILYFLISAILFAMGISLVIFGKRFQHFRGWFGDYIITIFIFFGIKFIFPRLNRIRLAIGVFIFSSAVELIQLSGVCDYYNLKSAFWQLTIGSRFDFFDIFLYAAGCLSAAVIDGIIDRINSK